MNGTQRDLIAELAMSVPDGQHYEHAPIQEAILEIRVSGVQDSVLDALQGVVAQPGYGQHGPEFDLTAEMGFDGEEFVSNAQRTHIGFRAIRDDGQRVLRAHKDRFSYSWVKPYDRWDSFIDEALAGWNNYCEVASPDVATRIGVRFINRIDIARKSVEIKDYLRTTVDISPYLPQALSGFFFQVDVPLDRHNASSRIISTLVQPEAPDTTSLVLDLDTWREVGLDLRSDDAQDTMAAHLQDLRALKNYVFEACITDATRGLIQ